MNLFPKISQPYYIYSPAYTHTSSGVQTLHLLCHALNEIGERAYMYITMGDTMHPELNTPLFRPEFQNFYSAHGIDPIVIYPDIVKGNPLEAKNVVRYLLAPAGAYGGDSEFPKTDNIWAAHRSISEKVLTLPVTNTAIFGKYEVCGYESAIPPRSGTCFYSHKYDRIHGNELLPLTENSVRLQGTPKQLADILRRSEKCYLYELSSVITEAALCGCPVELVRTPYFNTIPEQDNWLMGTVKWHDEDVFVKKSWDYLGEYCETVINFWKQLKLFVEDTKK